jgi:4-aminobutyrate aminotransferase/(S)-3-amino-2-methylpropionate transaminase
LTSKVNPYKTGFGPYVGDVLRVPFGYCYRCSYNLSYPDCAIACVDRIEDHFRRYADPRSLAGVIVEPVLGEGGFVVPPREYLPRLAAFCRRHGLLLIADEVQTGFGRTGRLFACEHFGVEPDLLVTAKSLAAGLPLSAITGRAEIMDAPGVGGLGGTFGGNPLACRAALAVLDLVEKERLPQRAAAIGEVVQRRFREWQERYEIIGDVRGLGAMVAMELVTDREKKTPAKAETKLVVKKCYEKRLLTIGAGTHNNVIRTLMPLVIGEAEVRRGLDILEEAISEPTARE